MRPVHASRPQRASWGRWGTCTGLISSRPVSHREVLGLADTWPNACSHPHRGEGVINQAPTSRPAALSVFALDNSLGQAPMLS